MLARGFRFAGQIGTLGKVESASIRATASASAAAAAKNEEMIVPGGCFFCYSDSFLPDFPEGWRTRENSNKGKQTRNRIFT